MVTVRSCCLCLNIRTGTFVLGSLGILLGGLLLAPVAEFLNHHGYYVTEFVKSERDIGKSMDDDEIPKMAFFSRVFFTTLLSLDVIYILSCALLLGGVSAARPLLMLPWLIFTFLGLVTHLTLVLAFMIALPDYHAAVACFASSPSLLTITYFWVVVYSCYQMIKKEEISKRGPQTGVTASSASHSSISSLKENITRAIRGTPPPPYEAVTSTKSPPRPVLKKQAKQSSCSSLVDLLHFKSSTEQSPRSTPSTSRRSSDGRASTKPEPVSPISVRKRSCAGSPASVAPPGRPLAASQSQTQLCSAATPRPHGLRKSQSNGGVALHHADLFIKFSRDSLGQAAPLPAAAQVAETENQELSDETSSMSSTSLSLQDTKIV